MEKQYTTHHKRLGWRARRGMLELDKLLIPFVENCFSTLSQVEQQSLENLLSCTDPELLSWLIAETVPTDPQQEKLVNKIRHYAKRVV